MVPTKVYVGLVLALLLGVGIALFGADYRRLQNAAAQNEQRGQVLTNTSQGVADGVDIDDFKAGVETGLAAGKEAFQTSKREAIRNEPETAARADRPVPDSVRRAYRERRLARERLGCAAGECGKDDQADAAAER